MCRMKFRIAIKYFVVCLLVYYTTKLMVVHNGGSHLGGHHEAARTSFELVPDMVSEEHGVNMARCETVVHVASLVEGADAARKFSYLLKSILYFRRGGLQLHLLTDGTSSIILKQLLETWELPYVSWRLVHIESLRHQVDESSNAIYLQALLPYLLPKSVEKVIFLGTGVRLLYSIEHLWDYFQDFAPYQVYGIPTTMSHVNNNGGILDILLLRISDKLRKTSQDLKATLNTAKTEEIQAVLHSYMNSQPYVIPCEWGVHVSHSFSLRECLERNQTKALILDPITDTPLVDPALRPYITRLKSVLSYDAELYRAQRISCSPHLPTIVPTNSSGDCQKYRTEGGMKRRTHLHFISQDKVSNNDPTDITVLTQFTLDRFETFERFMLNWEGYTVVVLHVTDAEALTLPEKIAQSEALKNRQQISYHLVFKRGDYYPINYLRNVGLSQTSTPYLLFVDVDLVPNPGIYNILKQYIQKHMVHTNNLTLVVPAFEALEELPSDFPQNKGAMLKLLEQKKVNGYRMQRKWNLGHKPTDYEKWKTTNDPYKVQWQDAFEPYVVLRSAIAPQYQETLLERMGDKIAYGREVFARGYEFMVLPDVFIIHLPHEVSPGTKLWQGEKSYLRCGARLFNEYRKELQHRYPSVNFN